MARLRPFNPRSGCQSFLDLVPAYISGSEYARAIAGFFCREGMRWSRETGTRIQHATLSRRAESRTSSGTSVESPPFGGIFLCANILAAAIQVRNIDELLSCVLQRDDRKIPPSIKELDLDVHVADGRLHKCLWRRAR